MFIFHRAPQEYDGREPHTTNSDWTDQEPHIEEVNMYIQVVKLWVVDLTPPFSSYVIVFVP